MHKPIRMNQGMQRKTNKKKRSFHIVVEYRKER